MSIEKVNALDQKQRDEALHQARLRLVGPEPEPGPEPRIEDFLARGTGRFPPGVTRTIRVLSIVTLLAAFLPSAIRLHAIGLAVFSKAITHVPSAYVAALCIVLLSESGQVIFSLAAATLTDASGRFQQWGLRFGAFTCTLIALAGNAEMVQPWAHAGLFVWLEAFAPPLLVLVTAQVLKSQMLHSIEDVHHAKAQYAQAHAAWQADYEERMHAWQDAYTQADQHPKWMHYAANALRDALRSANRRSYAVMRALTDEEWRMLVLREMRAEQWYERAEAQAQVQERIEAAQQERSAQSARSGASSGTHTGEAAGQVRFDDARNAWVAECPHCDYVAEKDSERGATNALAAHIGRWCKVRNATQVENVMESAMRAQYADANAPVEGHDNGRQ